MRKFSIRWWVIDPLAKYNAATEGVRAEGRRKRELIEEGGREFFLRILSGVIPAIGTFVPNVGDLGVAPNGEVFLWSGENWEFYQSSEARAKFACLRLASI